MEIGVPLVAVGAGATIPCQSGVGINTVRISLAGIITGPLHGLRTTRFPNLPIKHDRHRGPDPIYNVGVQIRQVRGLEQEPSLLANKRITTWVERRHLGVIAHAHHAQIVILTASCHGHLAAALARALPEAHIFRSRAE